MKNMMMKAAGIATVGMIGYVMINKRTRKKAEELLESMVDEADKTIKNMKNM